MTTLIFALLVRKVAAVSTTLWRNVFLVQSSSTYISTYISSTSIQEKRHFNIIVQFLRLSFKFAFLPTFKILIFAPSKYIHALPISYVMSILFPIYLVDF